MTAAEPAHVMVVDDDRLVLTFVSSGLRDAGFSVSEADSGEEAIEMAGLLRPEIAILDVRMRGMDGIEVARHLAAHTEVDFLFLTAYNDQNLSQEAARIGAMGYLVKPLDVRQIVPTVQAALARSRERRLWRAESHAAREVALATGILMANRGMDEAAALACLRKQADQAGIALDVHARRIVADLKASSRQ